MFEPSGSLPSAVYWRRRALAVGAAVLGVLLLVILGFSAMGSGGSPNNASNDPRIAGLTALSPTPETSPTPPSGLSLVPPSGSAPPSISGLTSPGAAPTPSAPPPPPQPCPDSSLALAATVGQVSYPIGQHPEFGMTVVNIGQQQCTKDVSRPLRNLVVSGTDGSRLWASNDCNFAAPQPEVQTLDPGQQLHYSITWLGRTSAPGCPRARQVVGAGSYTVTATIGGLSSAATPFTLT